MVAATKLSQFVSAGYAPYERYQKLWSAVFTWLTGSDVPAMEWQAATRPAYSKEEVLGENAYLDAIRANADCFLIPDSFSATRTPPITTPTAIPTTKPILSIPAETAATASRRPICPAPPSKRTAPNRCGWSAGRTATGNGGRSGPGLPLYGR